MKRTIKHRSVVPIYALAAASVIWALFLPLYKFTHFVLFIAAGVVIYAILSKLTTKTEVIELPIPTGDALLDALLLEGREAEAELKKLIAGALDETYRSKIASLTNTIGKIFAVAEDRRESYRQVRRFTDLFLPPVMKLVREYDKLQSAETYNSTGAESMLGISSVLDKINESYMKFLDSLYKNEALDIETDIIVIEQMLKREGLQ